jgi:toxin CcdB
MEEFLMAQFDVFPYSGPGAQITPFLVEVQSDLLRDLDTRMVIPLRRRDMFAAQILPTRLTPNFLVQDLACMLETPKMAAVPERILKNSVGSLAGRRDDITGAIDFLIHGY